MFVILAILSAFWKSWGSDELAYHQISTKICFYPFFYHTDINELKVFVDLASISAGENDLDVDRVACFHDAVLGYSSMLYELKSDTNFRVFKEVLKKLWKALDNDPNLPKKLVRLAFSFWILILHIRWIVA